MLKRYRIPLILCLMSVVGGVFPLGAAFLAGGLAERYGCVLHEGGVNPCIIWGADRGELLYQMFVLGWLGLFTLPVGILGCVGSLLIAGFIAVRSRWGNGA